MITRYLANRDEGSEEEERGLRRFERKHALFMANFIKEHGREATDIEQGSKLYLPP